ncbi:hypothetical protein NLU13_4557 [Sarocladium strictum]|uniref:SWIRM domain-containing protein n=1 Tax=Sarocladium strictum TaxID=5046 RepID=A0AA39GJ38_SARSR|nr:hypothetical protein NLU13_4557 [Sarocladium strictum]
MPPALPSISFDNPRPDTTSHFSPSGQSNSNFHSNTLFTMQRQPHQSHTMPSDIGYTTQLPHADTVVAPPEKPRDAHKIDISTLMSPPDPILDSFSNPTTSYNYITAKLLSDDAINETSKRDGRQPLPMSPPISPYSQAIAPAEPSTTLTPPSQTIKDPVLYPQDDSHSSSSPTHSPLFATVDLEHQRLVDQHIRNRSPATFPTGLLPPKPEDYNLALSFQTQVMKLYQSNRKGWLRQERAFLKADRAAQGPKRYQKLMAKPMNAKQAGKSNRADRVSKPTAPRSIRVTGTAHGPSGAARPSGRASATPDPSRRIVAPNREDKDFELLPDFSPPLDSLPIKLNSLKIDWKGSPIDLSGDPLAHLLHPDELLLAGNLRLDCATYLTSKRRMFIRRLECVGIGKEFRKTDAQQACKIDVNKASKLWMAFDRVGWLDQKWMKPHIHKLKDMN